MIIVVVWKNVTDLRSHAGEIHVVRPHDEGQDADGQRGVNQRSVARWIAGVVGMISATIPMAGRMRNVHLRMTRNQKRCCTATDSSAAHRRPAPH